jgi:hypothetical protein
MYGSGFVACCDAVICENVAGAAITGETLVALDDPDVSNTSRVCLLCDAMSSQRSMTVKLVKPEKNQVVTYCAGVIRATPEYALVRAVWDHPRLDLGYVTFEPGDVFFEHFYADRWYNVFELRSATGMLKGWYCNVTRPAIISSETIISEDLDLDLFVSAERDHMVRLDVEEFEARGLAQRDPHAYAAARAALEELERLACAGAPPFCV